jgi:hypothetical protein
VLRKKRLPAKLKAQHVRWAVLEAGSALKPGVKRRILAVGDKAIPELKGLLVEPDLVEPFGRHCALLLVALGPKGLEGLVDALCTLNPNTHTVDIVVQALAEQGSEIAPVIERHLHSSELRLEDRLLEVLARCGARSDAILARLLAAFAERPGEFAPFLADYGDPEALPHLRRHFDDTSLSSHEESMGNAIVKEIGEAILALGGVLSPEDSHKVHTAAALLKLQQHDLGVEFRDSD